MECFLLRMEVDLEVTARDAQEAEAAARTVIYPVRDGATEIVNVDVLSVLRRIE